MLSCLQLVGVVFMWRAPLIVYLIYLIVRLSSFYKGIQADGIVDNMVLQRVRNLPRSQVHPRSPKGPRKSLVRLPHPPSSSPTDALRKRK